MHVSRNASLRGATERAQAQMEHIFCLICLNSLALKV